MLRAVRRFAKYFSKTPLHPQWLLGLRDIPFGIASISGRLLDIGAADRWIEEYLPQGIEYIALDYPATGHVLYGARPHVFADAACLPFAENCFDGVTCLEVLEHVLDPAQVLAEIKRVLKPGGRGWISMPFLYPLHDAPFDFQRYTEYGLRREISRAGLELVSLQKTGHAIRTAGLLLCLALAGGVHARRGLAWLLVPFTLAAVCTINLGVWLLSQIWPDWEHMALGYALEVRKP